jgi:hypothetical protein
MNLSSWRRWMCSGPPFAPLAASTCARRTSSEEVSSRRIRILRPSIISALLISRESIVRAQRGCAAVDAGARKTGAHRSTSLSSVPSGSSKYQRVQLKKAGWACGSSQAATRTGSPASRPVARASHELGGSPSPPLRLQMSVNRSRILAATWARRPRPAAGGVDLSAPTYGPRLSLLAGLEIELSVGRPSWARTALVDAGTRAVVRDGLSPVFDPCGRTRPRDSHASRLGRVGRRDGNLLGARPEEATCAGPSLQVTAGPRSYSFAANASRVQSGGL